MNSIYKKIEIVGTSELSLTDAVNQAVERASKTVKHMAWFEVVEQRGRITAGKVSQFQVTLKIGFKLE